MIGYVDFSNFDWKTAKPSKVEVPYKLLCTTQKPAINFDYSNRTATGYTTHTQTQNSNMSVSSALPFIINAKDLVANYAASTELKLKNGKDISFSAEIVPRQTSKPVGSETAEEKKEYLKQGADMRYYQLEDSKMLMRLELRMQRDTDLNLSNKKNGYSESKDIKLPSEFILVFEGVYELR